MVTVAAAPNGDHKRPEGHCSRCGKVWTLNERRGVCQWCNKPASCITATSKPRQIKSRSYRSKRQAPVHNNGYDQLQGEWLAYYNVASRFTGRVKTEDKEDILHTIIATLADVERNNGHKPFTEAVMYRIASRTVADYWRTYYKINNGLDCHTCSKAQRHKCKEDDLYTECPKAIKLEYLSKPILDSEGNLTELGNLITDDKALDLDGWVSSSTWEIGYKPRLVEIAHKLKAGIPLSNYDMVYLARYRKREQKRLLQ
jgi:hypothetical protein